MSCTSIFSLASVSPNPSIERWSPQTHVLARKIPPFSLVVAIVSSLLAGCTTDGMSGGYNDYSIYQVGGSSPVDRRTAERALASSVAASSAGSTTSPSPCFERRSQSCLSKTLCKLLLVASSSTSASMS